MLMAVSTLSPVRTHNLMSALASSAMVAGTPAWSLSSMAVAPTTSRSRSKRAAARASFPLRSAVLVSAARLRGHRIKNGGERFHAGQRTKP